MELYNNKLDQYLQNMLKFGDMKHKIYEHIINELHDDNLFVIENDLGNPYVGIYVYNLHENLKEFEIIVNAAIENNNFDSATIDIIQNQKQEAESLVKLRLKHYQKLGKQKAKEIIKANKQFERYFISLYSTLNNISENESNESLQSKVDEINKALHDEKHNYTVSEFAENHIERLKELKHTLETGIQNSFEVKRVEPGAAQSNEDENRESNKYKIGMLIAQGDINKYVEFTEDGNIKGAKQGFSFPKITKEISEKLCIKVDRLYLTAAINDYSNEKSNGDKNVFNDLEIMQLIINDCEEKGTKVHPYFLKRFEDLKVKTI